MFVNEIRQKTIKELEKEMAGKKKELEKVMTDMLERKEKNTNKAGNIRKHIARVKTLINEKKILERIRNE